MRDREERGKQSKDTSQAGQGTAARGGRAAARKDLMTRGGRVQAPDESQQDKRV